MLLRFITLIVIGGIGWLFLQWAMPALALPPVVVTVVTILFVLVLLVALAGLFGFGPGAKFWGGWGNP